MICSFRSVALVFLLFTLIKHSSSFESIVRQSQRSIRPLKPCIKRCFLSQHFVLGMNNKRWDDEIEENSIRRAQRNLNAGSSGVSEMAAGAVLGGLLGGPFGALFGASIGSNIGAKNAVNNARKAEMERLGLTQETLDMANEVGTSLEQAYEGLRAIRESLSTQQKFAKVLDAEVADLYEKATSAIKQGDESGARNFLLRRTNIQDKLKEVLIRCAEEKKRLEQMEENVSILERRAVEVDSLMRRSVSAKTINDSTDLGLSLQSEDPLLKKFNDLGIY